MKDLMNKEKDKSVFPIKKDQMNAHRQMIRGIGRDSINHVVSLCLSQLDKGDELLPHSVRGIEHIFRECLKGFNRSDEKLSRNRRNVVELLGLINMKVPDDKFSKKLPKQPDNPQCLAQIKEIEASLPKDILCSQAFVFRRCPFDDLVYGFSSGCVPRGLDNKGWKKATHAEFQAQ